MSSRSVALYHAICSDVRQFTDIDSSIPFPGSNYKQFASSYLRHSIIRKWIPSDARCADKAALAAFTAANNRCRSWSYSPVQRYRSCLVRRWATLAGAYILRDYPGDEASSNWSIQGPRRLVRLPFLVA
jgi:hypothetical protein